jgi:hypothetical protein
VGGAASGNRSDALTVSVRDAEDNFEHSGITCGKDLAHDRECSLRMLLARHCSEPYYGRIMVSLFKGMTGKIELSQHVGGTG